ncbi:hypothetical protein B0H65DRAFT_283577 [Neurospora tetraspora]|uniref:Uncharacterized protein n=1 Tax=Neurospora tetraspora TaxID=94610 RepID=A0AAE0MN74_9PEZI|nr:hypothetical protein B0H65DRAFT_283577 [Neurospora tetraspora]
MNVLFGAAAPFPSFHLHVAFECSSCQGLVSSIMALSRTAPSYNPITSIYANSDKIWKSVAGGRTTGDSGKIKRCQILTTAPNTQKLELHRGDGVVPALNPLYLTREAQVDSPSNYTHIRTRTHHPLLPSERSNGRARRAERNRRWCDAAGNL